jgi:hypothetical protein
MPSDLSRNDLRRFPVVVPRGRPGAWGALAVSLGLLSGCGMIQPGPATVGPRGYTIQQIDDVSRNLADSYVVMMAEACGRVLDATDDAQVEERVLWLRVGTAQSMNVLAVGPNPVANLADLAVTSTLRREALEDHWIPRILGEVAEPMAAAARRGEIEIWDELEKVLTPAQIAELRAEIVEWRRAHPDDWYAGSTSLRSIAIERSERTGSRGGPRSIFAIAFLDPFASLDPAARQVELSRRFADRAMFALQRQPQILSWQAEHLMAAVASRSTGTAVLSGLDSAVDSGRRFAAVAENLPAEFDRRRSAAMEELRIEREAAIEQLRAAAATERSAAMEDFFVRLGAEREAIFASFDAEEGAIVAASSDLRETIRSGTELSESLKGTAAAIETLAARFEGPGPGEPSMSPAELREILDASRRTAEELTALAERVERIVASPELGTRLDESDTLLAAADARLRGTIDYAFGRLVRLAVIAGAVFLAAGLALRLVPGQGRRGKPA